MRSTLVRVAFTPALIIALTQTASITAAQAEEPSQAEELPAPLEPLPKQPPAPTSTTTTTSAEIEARPPVRDTPAAAANPTDEAAPADTRGMRLRQIDARATLNADALLAYIGLGMHGDIGVTPIGPGTLAVGAGFEYDFCGSTCWTFSAATPMDFSQRHIWPEARASYHFGLPRAKNLDLYPFLGLGPVFARSQLNVDNGAAKYVGTDTAVGINMGFGASYFPTNGPFFVGGEGHLRYAGGSYDYRLESGDRSRVYDKGAVGDWSLAGIDVLLALGVRIE